MKKVTILLALLGLAMVPGLRASEISQVEKDTELLRAIQAGDDAGVERILDLKADANKMAFEQTTVKGKAVKEEGEYNPILNIAIQSHRTKAVLLLLKHKADPTKKDYLGLNAFSVNVRLGHDKEDMALLLVLNPTMKNGDALHNTYNAKLSKRLGGRERLEEEIPLFLDQARNHLYHADTIRIKRLLVENTPLSEDPAGIVAAYAAHYHHVPGYEIDELLEKKPTPHKLEKPQKALDLAEEIYFDAPAKKPKINKEEIQQKIQELMMAGDFVEAQRLIDELHGKS